MKNESMEIKTFWEKLRDRKKKKQTKHKMVFIGESENKPEWESLERTGFTIPDSRISTAEAIENLRKFRSWNEKPRAIFKTKEGKE